MAYWSRFGGRYVCGCQFLDLENKMWKYLPQVKLDAHTTILSTASRTVLKQTFVNTSKVKPIGEVRYSFPLFDGVSVVGFICQIEDRTIYGLVKEESEAKKTYEEAKERGENAALLEQLRDAADVFTTSVSNIPAGSSIQVTITYIQELKHDAEVDGVRLTIPTSISPRYGEYPGQLMDASEIDSSGGISLTIDASMADGIPITKVISPSHPIEVTLGSLSTSAASDEPSMSKASATLALGATQLEKDFVLQVVAKDIGIPQAILETHPTIPNQRALMTTLVPKFNLKSQKPEIVFIADRSGSMEDNIPTLIEALKVFLKSIPVGCMFNICSFGSRHEFLWPKSQLYGQDTLAKAIKYVSKFNADFGGTETLNAVKACFEKRRKGIPSEFMLLTDGDIWSQQSMFDYLAEQTKNGDVRVFPIGIGGGVSSALIEGVARSGGGFAQMVANNEKLDSKIVRMLKGALTPHIGDYRLDIKYDDGTIESATESLRINVPFGDGSDKKVETKPISLYDPETKEEHPKADESKDIFAGLPKFDRPMILQAPLKIPQLFPFNRTCVYLLMGPGASNRIPKSVLLKGTSPQGPLELEILVQVRQEADEMIHQLAARRATQELEEGGGWVSEIRTDKGALAKDIHPAEFTLLQKREAVRLGVEFQVGGKHCSFVAVEANEAEIIAKRKKALEASINGVSDEDSEEWELLQSKSEPPPYSLSSTEAWRARQAPGLRRGMTRKVKLSAGAPCPPSDYEEAPVTMQALAGGPELTTAVQSARRAKSKSPFGSLSLPRAGLVSSFFSKRSAPQTKGPVIAAAAPAAAAAPGGAQPAASVALPPPAPAPRCEVMDAQAPSGAMGIPVGVSTASRAADGDRKMSLGANRRLSGGGWAARKAAPKETKTQPTGPLLQRLIERQSFEGSWPTLEDVCDEMSIKKDGIKTAVAALVSSQKDIDRGLAGTVVNTAVVITFLESKMAQDEDTWELVVDKARDWLDNAVGEAALVEVWKLAKGIVGA